MKTYKALSALLEYPTEQLVAALPQLRAALEQEQLAAPASRACLATLVDRLATEELLASQEHYTDLFDRVRSLSLHLFEHVHGESRDRGQAMVDLKTLYAHHGLVLEAPELPDYLPVFLEFLSRLQPQEAAELLAETTPILAGIGARLRRRGSAYAGVFDTLVALAGAAVPALEVAEEEIRREDDPAQLDAAWEEQPAFGVPQGCGASAPHGAAVVRFHRRAA